MQGFTKVPYIHAGFPKIDAVGKFRANVVNELDQQQVVLNREVKDMKAYIGKSNIQTPSNSLRVKKNNKSPLKFEAYLDKSGYTKLTDNIIKEIKRKIEIAMEEALVIASVNTTDEIVNMRRAFKGEYNPSERTSGDLYDKVGNSLWYGRKQSAGANQFISFNAGSYDVGQSHEQEPTGVIGSRGANLTELTAEGTGSFRINSHPLGGTKRLVNHLKNARGG
jgi:hypothetical protein